MAFEHFNLLAPLYDRLLPFGEMDVLIRRFELPVPGMLLDAGGGTGRISARLSGMAGQVIVADVSAGMLKQAKKKGLGVVNAPAEGLPFSNNTFERVLMMDALHHVENQNFAAQELWRVLKPGGRLLIVEPDIRKWIVKGIALFEKIALMRSHFIPPDEIVALFPGTQARAQVELASATAWVIVQKGV